MKKLLLLPALIVVFAITSKAQVKEKTPPPPPPPPPKVVEVTKWVPVREITGKQADEFYDRNPTVAKIFRVGNVVKLAMKDKSTEKYNMSKKEEKKSFTDKYGEVPIPDPPPPPPPPVIKKQS